MAKRSCDPGNANTRTRAPPWRFFVSGCDPVHRRTARADAANKGRFPTTNERRSEMRRGIIALGAVGLLAAAAAVGAATLGPGSGAASSHREAPLIAEDPSADLDGPVRVPQSGQAEHRHDPRQRRPRRGSGGRAQLVHVLSQRALQPHDRHERGCAPERHVPVPVPDEDRPVLPRRHRAAVHGDARRRREGDRSSRAERHRRTTSAHARPRTTDRSPRRVSSRSPAAARRSPVSVTIRSSATSARSSISSRSARARATWAAARTSSPATASTRSACRSRSRA